MPATHSTGSTLTQLTSVSNAVPGLVPGVTNTSAGVSHRSRRHAKPPEAWGSPAPADGQSEGRQTDSAKRGAGAAWINTFGPALREIRQSVGCVERPDHPANGGLSSRSGARGVQKAVSIVVAIPAARLISEEDVQRSRPVVDARSATRSSRGSTSRSSGGPGGAGRRRGLGRADSAGSPPPRFSECQSSGRHDHPFRPVARSASGSTSGEKAHMVRRARRSLGSRRGGVVL